MYQKQDILRYSIALIFLIFGGLKFFPQLSPAEIIGSETVYKLSCGLLPQSICIKALAILEVGIGVLLFVRKWIRIAIPLAIAHLAFTFAPFVLFPGEVFNLSINSLSLLGQYILKNIIIISALFLIYPSKENYRTVLS